MQWLNLPGLAGALLAVAIGLITMYKTVGEHAIQIAAVVADLQQHRAEHKVDFDRQERRNDAQDEVINEQGKVLARVDQNVANLVDGIKRIETQVSRN